MGKKEPHAFYFISVSLLQSFFYWVLLHMCTYIWPASMPFERPHIQHWLFYWTRGSSLEHSAGPAILQSSLKWDLWLWLHTLQFLTALDPGKASHSLSMPDTLTLQPTVVNGELLSDISTIFFQSPSDPWEDLTSFVFLRFWRPNQCERGLLQGHHPAFAPQ